jgi:DNA-binding winged helix-turn-helix (wHTH) protein
MRVVFGAFTLDLDRRELYRQDRVQPLEPKAFSVLAYLLTHRDRAIAKEELLAACWPGEFVTDAALARCVQVIRRAVADDGGQQQVIKTLRGYGYRFVATVSTLPAPAAATAPTPGAVLPTRQRRSAHGGALGRRGGGVAGGGPRRPCSYPALSAVSDGQSGYAAVLCRVWPGAVAAVPALWVWQRRD